MRQITYYAVALLLLLGVSSCVKDNGNYDYRQLTPIEIDFGLSSGTIVAQQRSMLTITPTVMQGSSDENLTYRWQLKDDLNTPDPDQGYFTDSLISNSKNLSFKLDIPARTYHLLLYATDKTNGVTVYKELSLKVETLAPQGLMVLSESNGVCDVSIVLNPEVNAAIEGYSKDQVEHHIFSTNNPGTKAEGEGAMIVAPRNGGSHIYLFMKGTKGGYRLSNADLRIVGDFCSNFRDMKPSDVKFEGFNTWSYNELMVNNGSLYFCSKNSSNGLIPYDVRCFGDDYVASPYIGVNERGSYYYGVFYDTKNGQFKMINSQQLVSKLNAGGTAFNIGNPIGKEIVYGEMAYPSGTWNCLMQDPADPTTRKIYACNLTINPSGPTANIGAGLYDVSHAERINEAKFFAFGNRGPVFFYATSDQLYRNAYQGNASSTTVADIASEYPGYTISSLWLFNDKTSNPILFSKLLYVGIWNATTGQGKLLQYTIDETNGTPTGTPKVYEGFGKIVSTGYKWK